MLKIIQINTNAKILMACLITMQCAQSVYAHDVKKYKLNDQEQISWFKTESYTKTLSYDSLGFPNEIITEGISNSLYYRETLTRDGLKITKKRYNEKNELRRIIHETIDEFGLIQYSTMSDANGNAMLQWHYFYEENGFLFRKALTDTSGNVLWTFNLGRELPLTSTMDRQRHHLYQKVASGPIAPADTGKQYSKFTYRDFVLRYIGVTQNVMPFFGTYPHAYSLDEFNTYPYYTQVEDIMHYSEQLTQMPIDNQKVIRSLHTFLEEKKIVEGSCYDWINAIYTDAGFVGNKRITAYNNKKREKFCNPVNIEAGDWLMYLNHSFNMVEHSGIFICWIDIDNGLGITASYRGMNSNAPGRFKSYYLGSVYRVDRPKF